MRVGIVGASGYTGGELLRLLLLHPKVEVTMAISREYANEYVFRVHPNLRGVTDLKFHPFDVAKLKENCDLIFMSTPHGVSSKIVPEFLDCGLKVIDLSADFRLKNSADYETWYGWTHPHKDLLEKAVYGLPELHREEIKNASFVACPGCIATSAILGLAPVVKDGIVDRSRIIVDAKIGSSGIGGKPSLSTHHPERHGVIRIYKPVGHRHTSEIEMELSRLAREKVTVAMSCHAVDVVRGILTTNHAFLTKAVQAVDVWRSMREFYKNEPFIRLVKERKGTFRYPDPKIIIGSNFCDLSFELDAHANRLVTMSAIDNLMKGAAGQAVQDMNIMLGFDERTGLEIPGFHPL